MSDYKMGILWGLMLTCVRGKSRKEEGKTVSIVFCDWVEVERRCCAHIQHHLHVRSGTQSFPSKPPGSTVLPCRPSMSGVRGLTSGELRATLVQLAERPQLRSHEWPV